MKKIILLTILQMCFTMLFAQKEDKSFRAYLYNNEFSVYLHIWARNTTRSAGSSLLVK